LLSQCSTDKLKVGLIIQLFLICLRNIFAEVSLKNLLIYLQQTMVCLKQNFGNFCWLQYKLAFNLLFIKAYQSLLTQSMNYVADQYRLRYV
jgi:hypothetical protein